MGGIMSEIQFRPKGVHAIIAVAAVAILIVVRFATFQDTKDPSLHQAIQLELSMRLGDRTGQEIANVDTTDRAAVETMLRRADADGIKVHSASISRPLLSFGRSDDVAVRVEYSLPGSQRRTEYWLFDYTGSSWQFPRTTFALSYYLNFL